MLTPVDIENKEFTRAFRGYDQTEIDEFMRILVADYEKLYRENGSLKDKNNMLTETLNNYKGMESTMQNAILMAQKTAEEIKQNAFKAQEATVKDAEYKAKEIVGAAEKKALELENKYKDLKREMTAFKARMSSLLTTYMSLLDEVSQSAENVPETVANSNDAEALKKSEEENAEKEAFIKENFANKPQDEKVNGDTAEFNMKNLSDNKTERNNDEKQYAPKKVNPIVDELLKKRESNNVTIK